MTREEIQKLFHNPPAECILDWCRFRNPEEEEKIIKEQSKEFRQFWQEKILNSSYEELTESDMNRVIVFLDSTSRGSGEFRLKGGVAIAKANLRMSQWHKAFLDLKHKQDIREIANQILIEKDDNVIIDLVNQLERVNRGNGNGLTSAGTIILSAILFIYNPDRYLSMLHLAHRLALIDFFGLGERHNYQTYGEQIVKTKNDIISGFKEKYGIDTTPYRLSFFVYCQLNGKYNWESTSKKQISIPKKSTYHSATDEVESPVVSQRERIPDKVKYEVWRRDGGKCANCGGREKLEYDHIVPISKGGSNTVRNIELLCESCNRKKSNKI